MRVVCKGDLRLILVCLFSDQPLYLSSKPELPFSAYTSKALWPLGFLLKRSTIPPLMSKAIQSKPSFFYGWVMLGIAIVAATMTMPGQTAGVSLFNPSFEEALNLNRTQLTGAYAMGTFLASFAMTYVGAQMDRYGIRRVMGAVVVLLGLACVYTGFVTGFWMLFIAFLFLRMFGQGSLSLLSQNTAAMWFDKRLGLVQASINIGFSIGSAFIPAFVFWLITQFGWRTAYPILGLVVVVVMLPLIFFFYVNRPEDIGQTLDGIPELEAQKRRETELPSETSISTKNFTLAEAMRTPAYWIIAGMMFSVSMIGTAIAFNSLFLFDEFGLTQDEIVRVLATIALTQAVMQIGAGWLSDLFPLRWLAMINMVGQFTAVGLLLFIDSISTALTFAVVAGLFNALHNGIVGPLWARYFGRAHLGKIRGSIATATVSGSSLGPFVMGGLFDWTGSYTPSIVIFMVVYAIFIVLTPWAKRP